MIEDSFKIFGILITILLLFALLFISSFDLSKSFGKGVSDGFNSSWFIILIIFLIFPFVKIYSFYYDDVKWYENLYIQWLFILLVLLVFVMNNQPDNITPLNI